jgi:hypothetical protein
MECLIIELDGLVTLLKTFLEFLDFKLEFLLFFLVLGLESKDLIVGLICVFGTLDVIFVDARCVPFYFTDLLLHLYYRVLGKPNNCHSL